MLLPATNNMMPSAHLMMCEFLRTFAILFAKIINNKGPKKDPCRTPQVSKPDFGNVLL